MAKGRKRRAAQYGAQLLDNPQGERRERSPAEEEARKYKHWMDEITAAKKVFKPYWERGRKILKLYKDERKEMGEIARANDRMNILWSNVETLKPAMYSKTPTPNVSRRFMDGDPVSRTASTILERCLITAIDLADFDYPMQRATLDYLLPGRGTVWVRYAPQMGMAPMREPVTRIDMGESGAIYRPFKGGDEIDAAKVKKDDDGLEYYETDPEEQVLAHGLDLDHLMWSDYMHEPVNDWTKVGWQCKRVDMKRPQLIKEFGEEKGRKVQLNKSFNAKPDTEDSTTEKGKPDCAEVYEIWSKDHRKVCWVSDGLPNELLKEQDDPLRLHDFWPLPRPIFATLTTDSLIPVPDYALYQDQAEQLDRITDRIRLLIQALRVVGVYNAEMAVLQTLLDETAENEMVPVENWITFAQQGGLKGLIDWLPIEQIATVLAQLFTARAQIKQDLYEVTGISDVIRGATAPEETATAQQIKANFGNLRLQARQTEMARFARDTIRKMAEIIAEHFPAEELIEMSGVMSLDEFRVKPEDFKPESQDPQAIAAAQQAMFAKQEENKQKLHQAIALIKSDKLRTFKIDIETDATVAPDQQKEKEARVEFLTAVAPFIEKAALVGQQAPQLVPLLMKMLDFGVKGFRAGRSLENAIEETIALTERMQSEAEAAPQGPPPDPAAEAQAAKLQAETDKLKQELTTLQAEAALKAQENQAKTIENQRRADEQRQLHNQQMLKLTEEIAFRKQENTKRLQELDATIELTRLKIQQLEAQTNADFVSIMDPQQPQPTPVDDANSKAALAEAQVKLIDAQTRYAELVKRGQGLEGIGDALGGLPEADPSKIGTPAFARKRGPKKKLVDFIRDPETNQIKGATIDEIELPPEEEDAA